MPSDRLEAQATNLHELLDSDKDFLAPLFQRLYVWKEDEAQRLWGDIDQVLAGEDTARFLGAVVLQDHSSSLVFHPKRYWIIDGQQRLTTLYLLLIAVASEAERTNQDGLAREIVKGYLLNQRGEFVNRPKLRPTNRDLRQFNAVLGGLKSASAVPYEAFGDDSGRLTEMHRRLVREVRTRGNQAGPEFLQQLLTTVVTQLKFVQIVLSSDENPHQVYDSLNTAGQRLGIIDLVRNEVFSRYQDVQAAENLYNKSWRSFEDSLGDDLESYFFPFTLVHRPTTTKSRTMADLKAMWKTNRPEEILDQLLDYVPPFKALTAGEALSLSPRLVESINRLHRMPAPASTLPYTMQVVHEAIQGELDHNIAASCLDLVESFLVRRAFAGLEPTGLHAVFKGMWQVAGGDPEELIRVIDDNATISFPTDDEFAASILKSDLYHRKLATYVVMEYERGLGGGDPVPEGVVPTLDHVMPQKHSGDWLMVVGAEDHKSLLHTWANLVPLSLALNAEKSLKSWSSVRALYETETVFKTTKRLAKDYQSWTAETIRNRAGTLASWALARWPRE